MAQTARPFINDGTSTDYGGVALGDIPLGAPKGAVESETMDGTRTLLNLSDAQGYTKNVRLSALISGERTITITGTRKFSSLSAKETFIQGLDALWQGTQLFSVKYYPYYSENVYAGQAYMNVMVTEFTCSCTEVEEFLTNGTTGAVTTAIVHYTLYLKEGLGVDS